ncbi:hypothetical protein TRVA0_001S04632 [Trichomonascus vanleenenianus]|uniref:AAA family ATPase CDC6 n=1 Tax=Trichomonascus vanleenenianus TaxID=2268995 RepID=UPI003ECA321C
MLKELSNNRDIHVASINCMTVDKPHDIYSLVYNSLVPEARALSHKEACRELEALVIKPRGRRISRVVVLDELDHILTKDQDILFKLFQLAFAKNTTLILIGISNALDLTDRFLPRLKSNSLVPTILAFQPYSAQEIAAILEKRLLSLSPGPPGTRAPLMHPAAIQLCARKTTANTGDLRKAFDICRRAIELVEEEVRTNVVTTPENLGGGAPGTPSKRAALRDSRNALATMSLAEAPIVTAMHVMKVCSQSFGGSAVARIKALNLQQKAILCVMVHLRATSAASGAAGGLTVKSVFDRYVQACAQDKMLGRLQHGEFLEVIGALEAAGLVSIPESVKGRGSGARGRGAGHSRITTTVRMLDIMNATNDTPVLRQLVKDISR